MNCSVMDQCVRLGFAIVLIALVSVGLYQFAGHSAAFVPATPVTAVAK